MSGAATAFRDRKVLFAVLLVLLAADVAVLVSYRTFYGVRLRALLSERDALVARRDEVRRAAEAAAASEKKLFETQEALTTFFSETLGKREERIAPLLEEVYRTTREAGLRPDAISYSSIDEPGTDALTMSFAVAGPYRDVKRLLAALEESKRFLVVERLALAGGAESDPEAVRITITFTNYFRPSSLRPIRKVRDTRAAGAATLRPSGAAPKAGRTSR
ncbi:MAG: GspMb/PilO family protein [Thermoanaerobaculia bacterium]